MILTVDHRSAVEFQVERAAANEAGRVVIDLPRHEIFSIRIFGRLTVLCLEGQLWVTQYRDPDDVVLGAGGSFELSRSGVSIAQALRRSRLALVAPAKAPVGGSMFANFFQGALGIANR